MTAIAQCGKGEVLLDSWMVLDGETAEDEEDFNDAAEADEAEATEREDCEIEEATTSAYVVWIAKKVGFVVCEPSSPFWFVMIQKNG